MNNTIPDKVPEGYEVVSDMYGNVGLHRKPTRLEAALSVVFGVCFIIGLYVLLGLVLFWEP